MTKTLDYTNPGLHKPWITQTLDYPNPGLPKPWITQTLDYTNPGLPKPWITQTLDYPNPRLHKPWITQTLDLPTNLGKSVKPKKVYIPRMVSRLVCFALCLLHLVTCIVLSREMEATQLSSRALILLTASAKAVLGV